MNTTSRRLSHASIAVLVLAGLAQFAKAASGTWVATTSSNWSDTTRWAGGIVADGAGATALFNTNITGPRTITIDTISRTLGILTFGDTDDNFAYTFASSGGATLTFNNNGSTAQINALATGHANRISTPILLADSVDINNAVNDSALGFIAPGGITASTAGTKTITNKSTGTDVSIASVIGDGSGTVAITQNSTTSSLSLSGVNTYTGATTVTAGTLVVATGGSINSTSGVSVASGATFTNNSATGFNKALSLSEGATLNGTMTPTSMTITGNLSDGFATIALGTKLTRGGNLELTLTGVAVGTYTLFSGTVLGTFATMTIGGISLTNEGGGNFMGIVGGDDYTFTNSTSQLIVAVPEPAAWALLGISGLFFMVCGRFRRMVGSRKA